MNIPEFFEVYDIKKSDLARLLGRGRSAINEREKLGWEISYKGGVIRMTSPTGIFQEVKANVRRRSTG